MQEGQIGVWLIGAWGGVSTTTVLGLAALQQNLTGPFGLVSELPQFARLDLVAWDRLVVGGHEVRSTSFAAEAAAFHRQSRVFDEEILQAVGPTLQRYDANVRPGILANVGETIAGLASEQTRKAAEDESAWRAIERMAADIDQFRAAHQLEHVIVVNLASTEPPLEGDVRRMSWDDLEAALTSSRTPPVRASTLYAVAAIQSGCTYVNFTPSIGSDLPAVCELAEDLGVLHAGRDGKTGETLMKSVLAPMFAARNLGVMSWVGHNIFGNLDGKVLDDPANKANKMRSKDHLLTEILGYRPQTLVSIEYIESMGDWKTAWDHVHFRGFLGTPMTLQFIWQGCDSLLAAPLVLDLVRFAERERRRGTGGVMRHLASFFKSPMGRDMPPEFHQQFDLLEAWARELGDEGHGAGETMTR